MAHHFRMASSQQLKLTFNKPLIVMKFNFRMLTLASLFLLFLLSVNHTIAQEKTSDKKEESEACNSTKCRGSQTKFGEAKVITELRSSLVALRKNISTSSIAKFDISPYNMNDIVGKTDNESLQIIIREVKSIESVLADKLDKKFSPFSLPDNKARQIKYLQARIKGLQASL